MLTSEEATTGVLASVIASQRPIIWSTFFGQLRAWQRHPGYFRENATRPTIEEDAAEADQMLAEFDKRFAWPSSR